LNERRLAAGWLLALFLVGVAQAQPSDRRPIRLRVVARKRYYRPGESVTLELRCDPKLTDEVIVLFNPGAADEGGGDNPSQKCPYSRFRLVIPKDFVGDATASVLRTQTGEFQSDRVWFEVRSDAKPKELWMRDLTEPFEELRGSDTCPPLSYDSERSAPQRLPISALLTDGIRLSLCGERGATFRTDPAADFPFVIERGSCFVTPRRAGSFRVTASYRGLTESWVCTVAGK
jgi:hypothetical protein